jgi:hypothetical protein
MLRPAIPPKKNAGLGPAHVSAFFRWASEKQTQKNEEFKQQGRNDGVSRQAVEMTRRESSGLELRLAAHQACLCPTRDGFGRHGNNGHILLRDVSGAFRSME